MLNDFDLSPSDFKITEADLEDLVKGCSKGKCEFCIKKAGFTGKIANGPFLPFDINYVWNSAKLSQMLLTGLVKAAHEVMTVPNNG